MMWVEEAVVEVASFLLKAGEVQRARWKEVMEAARVARSLLTPHSGSLAVVAGEGPHAHPLLLEVEAGAVHRLLQE
jgi:hypothetical protein